jgi:hypothetical protein
VPLALASKRSSCPITVAGQAIDPAGASWYNTRRTPIAGAPESSLTAYRWVTQLHPIVFPNNESGISGAPDAGVGNGEASSKNPRDRAIGDAKTVSTKDRPAPTPLSSVSGPVESLQPAAVNATAAVTAWITLGLRIGTSPS